MAALSRLICKMEPRVLQARYYSLLPTAVLFLMLAASSWARNASANDSPLTGTPGAAPYNALGQSLPVQAQNELIRLINSERLTELRWPNVSDYRDQLLTFYEAGAYTLAWIRDEKPAPQALALIELFKAASEDGLKPEDYDASRWDRRLTDLQTASAEGLLHFDLAITVCTMRYVSALHAGRVNPQRFKFGIDVGPKRYDLTEFLRNEVVYSGDVKRAIAEVEPRYAGYRRLKQALSLYLKLAAEGDGQPVPVPPETVRPGHSYSGMPELITRLSQLGDVLPPGGHQSGTEALIYQGAVVDAVRRFQHRHGLEPDGFIGRGTVAALNTPLKVRVEQLQFALERYRWIPENFPQPPIVVNIPEFRLRTMIRQPGARPLDMAVVVGKAYQHRTPVFANYMRYLIFRPYWEVPPSIVAAELIPKIRRNPNYAAANNFIVAGPGDVVIVDGAVSNVVLDGLRSGAYRMRQKPGPRNSLGPIKFIFPNSYNVYMHGTPATQLFSRSRRDFSHGCIRLEHPLALAEWVLHGNPEWPEDRIVGAINGAETITVNLPHPIPVLILYSTAVVAPNGETRFFNDIYGYDAALQQVLQSGYPYGN